MLEVIHEDNDIIVCRKSSGIPVQTAKPGQADMVSLLKNYRSKKGETPEIYMVHRLDQPVEGVMVFAKHQQAAAVLSKQIQQKSVDKCYRALVEGVPNPLQGTMENYLLRDGKTNTSKVVPVSTKGAKKAVLHYKVLQTQPVDNVEQMETEMQVKSLVEIQLETGRHHQIRVQMAHAGHPLVGDKKYNPMCQSGYLPIGLCSIGLAFEHPATGKRMEFSVEPKGAAFENFKKE